MPGRNLRPESWEARGSDAGRISDVRTRHTRTSLAARQRLTRPRQATARRQTPGLPKSERPAKVDAQCLAPARPHESAKGRRPLPPRRARAAHTETQYSPYVPQATLHPTRRTGTTTRTRPTWDRKSAAAAGDPSPVLPHAALPSAAHLRAA